MNPRRPPAHQVRLGATLTEVLMALLVMGLGVTSVISLFPIAILRSVQATQLTNSRMMRQNVEQLFRTQFRDSIASGVTFGVLNHHTIPGVAPIAQPFRGEWVPGAVYAPGQIVVPPRQPGQSGPLPNRWFACRDRSGDPGPVGPYTSGSVEPNWNVLSVNTPLGACTDGLDITVGVGLARPQWHSATGLIPAATFPIQQQIQPIGLLGTAYDALNYVVDPLGWATFNAAPDDLAVPVLVNDFGYKVDRATKLGTRSYFVAGAPLDTRPILRLNGGLTTPAAARQFAAHPDSWREPSEDVFPKSAEVLAAYTPTTATYPPNFKLEGLATDGSFRVVLTSLSNPVAIPRTIAALPPVAPAQTVAWVEPLPAGFVPDGPARIEQLDLRYTWLATVNKNLQGDMKVTVAVFFNRLLQPENEHIYNANFGNTGALGAPFTVPPVPFSVVGFDQVRLVWDPTTEPDPLLREGNYLLDGRHLSWYRIVAVSAAGAGTALLTVDRPIPTADRTIDPTAPATVGRAILMRGIVELFEL